ncbi:SGNH family hydrolase [Jiella sp. M17.18]|uniref:SGNH/GDSL hydrolase family protein n=1 Tax=Jiella sp. M17.18 TaxID=3234247 RepID=UPI0034DF6A2D
MTGSRTRRGWIEPLRSGLQVLAVALAAILVVALSAPDPAAAQQRPRSILEMLFGGGTQPVQPPRVQRRVIRTAPPRPPRRSTRSTRSSSSRDSAKAPTASASDGSGDASPAAKDIAAKTVLVVGDFMAGSLAKGLDDVYSDNKMVDVTSDIDGSSGLVRDDHFDWPKKLGPIIDREKPDVLVVMLGSNDRQIMNVGSQSLTLRSDAWNAEYERRVNAIADIAEKKKVPLVWVGMPSFKYDRMSEDMIFFNDLYRKAATRVSGEFVDVWDGFVDADGQFVYSGPGVNGQTVQLRNSDGITMTDAGSEKLAFFAQKAIDRVLGDTSGAAGIRLSSNELPNMQLPPITNAANAVSTPPVSLDDPKLDGGDTLLGGGHVRSFALEPSPRDKLVLNGAGTGHIEGRADDFGWNEKSAAVAPGNAVAYRGTIDLDKVRAHEGIKPPPEMPSLVDAIVADWSKENAQAQQGVAKPAK